MISIDLSIVTPAQRAALVRVRNAESGRGGPPLTTAECTLWHRLVPGAPIKGTTMLQLEEMELIAFERGAWTVTPAGYQTITLLTEALASETANAI